MARKRMIDPCLWEDEHFGLLSDKAKILFIACISNADDYGKLNANSANLRAIAFRFEEISIRKIEELVLEITERVKHFKLYEVKNIKYVWLEKWDYYQKQREERKNNSRFPDYVRQMSDRCQTDVRQMSAQDKLSKDKLSKDKLSKDKLSTMSADKRQTGVRQALNKSNLKPLQTIVDYYKEIKGYTNIKEWDKINYSRFCKTAKKLMEVIPGGLEIKSLIDWTNKYSQERSLEWTLETCLKYYSEWVQGKTAKKMTAVEKRDYDDRVKFFKKHGEDIKTELKGGVI